MSKHPELQRKCKSCGEPNAPHRQFLDKGALRPYSSCRGCETAAAEAHILGKAPGGEFRTWKHMLLRCFNTKSHEYHNYGGRGITVALEWVRSFEKFLADMGPRPSSKHSIDRIDVNGNYGPGNCRWASPKEQANNRRHHQLLTLNGETRNLMQWAEYLAVPYEAIRHRLRAGWSDEQILTTPFKQGKKHSRPV